MKLWGIVDGDMKDLRAEIERMRLTDEEREAVGRAALNWTSLRWSKVEKNAATLRNLLERLK